MKPRRKTDYCLSYMEMRIVFSQCGTRPKISNQTGGLSCLTVRSVTDGEPRDAVSVMDAALLDVPCARAQDKRVSTLAVVAVARENTRAMGAEDRESILVTGVEAQAVT